MNRCQTVSGGRSLRSTTTYYLVPWLLGGCRVEDRRYEDLVKWLFQLVGVTGFEPVTR